MTLQIHTFRDPTTGLTHGVTSTRNTVSRRSRPRALCATVVTPDFQRRTFNPNDPTRMSPITCDSCLRSVVGMVDALETDFGFHGRRVQSTPDHPHIDCEVCDAS